MPLQIQYHATDLADIATMFEARAAAAQKQADAARTKVDVRLANIEAQTWAMAAADLRNTTLAPSAGVQS